MSRPTPSGGLHLDRRAVLGALALGALAPRAVAKTLPIRLEPDKELMVPVEGGRIYVRVNGDLTSRRPPLIYMHGGPGGNHIGLLSLTALADDRAVILYDQLDSGRSDAPEDPANWRVPRFVDELDRIREALGVERWHVGGGSWGGTLALEYGARRPRALQSLIIQSPLVSTRSWMADAARLRRRLPAETRDTLTACDAAPPPDATVCDAATKAYYDAYVRRSTVRSPLLADYAGRQPRRAGRVVYEQMWGKSEFSASGVLADYDGEPLLKKLNGPRTLFVCGEYDEATPATVSGFARRVPGSTFREVKGAAHAILADRPAAFLELISTWCSRLDRPV